MFLVSMLLSSCVGCCRCAMRRAPVRLYTVLRDPIAKFFSGVYFWKRAIPPDMADKLLDPAGLTVELRVSGECAFLSFFFGTLLGQGGRTEVEMNALLPFLHPPPSRCSSVHSSQYAHRLLLASLPRLPTWTSSPGVSTTAASRAWGAPARYYSACCGDREGRKINTKNARTAH